MAVYTCPECNKDVSESGAPCPHCGAEVPWDAPLRWTSPGDEAVTSSDDGSKENATVSAAREKESGKPLSRSFKALRKRYMSKKQYDKAWCVCSALCAMKEANDTEKQFFEQYRPGGVSRAKSRMTDRIWREHVLHADADPGVNAIFAAIAPVVGAMTARPHKQFGLRRKDRRDLATDQLLFSKVFSYVTSVLNVVEADLYLQPQRPAGLQMAHTVEFPSFVVGADLLQGRSEKELVFVIAKELSNLHAEHFLRRVLPAASQLRVVLFAAMKMCSPQYSVPSADVPEVDKILKHVKNRMHPAQLEQLARAAKPLLDGEGEVDLEKWLIGVEKTANRVGLIVCSDLKLASKLVTDHSSIPAEEQKQDMLLYSASEDYFTVREELGISIDA